MKTISRFFLLLKPHFGKGISLFLISLLSSLITVGTPFLYKLMVDKGITMGNTRYLAWILFGILASMACKEFLFLVQRKLILTIRVKVFAKLRMDLYAHLLKMPQSFYAQNHRARLLSRITSDVDAVQNLFLENYVYLAQSILVSSFIMVILLFIKWEMVAFALLFLPVLFILFMKYKNKISLWSGRVQEKHEGLMERLQEDLSMVKAIQSYSVLEDRMSRTNRDMADTEGARSTLSFYYSKASSSTIVINMIGLVVIWGLGGREVAEGEMSIGTLIAISFFLNYVVNLFFNVYNTFMGFHASIPAARSIFEIFDYSPSIASRDDAVDIKRPVNRIAFNNVAFSYRDNHPVFSGVTFTLRKGELIGVVGGSGQGKTTLANLMLRFFDPVEGAIEIDGIDIRQLKLEELRKNAAIVPQEEHLFNLSIRENVIMGRKDITEERFLQACAAANVSSFAETFDEGYETVIGENGSRLSSGQRKRISIARALLENPFILIFDEATSVLDERTESEILDTIAKLATDRIVLIITHKLSNIEKCDKILRVHEGCIEIVERNRLL